MRALFSPATALMNRLRYPRKFMLLGIATLMVTAVLLSSLYATLSRELQTARDEFGGVQMLKPINRMVQVMQQHRGLSSGVLNGNEAMKEKRAAKEKEVIDAMEAVNGVLSDSLRGNAQWKDIRQNWDAIRSDGLKWTPADNIRRHAEMIERTLTFMVEVADETQLTLDPMMDTYYFMDTIVASMPAILEPMGMARARGTGVLTRKEMSAEQRQEISLLIAKMASTLRAQDANIAKVIRYAPELQGALSAPAREFSEGAEKFFALVRGDILGEKFATPPQEYFATATQVIDSGYKVMFDVLMPQFEKRLQERIDAAKRELFLDFALALFVGALVCYFSIGFYYSVQDSVVAFSSGARRLASGDLTVTFPVEGADELHAAGHDFNDMANAFRKFVGNVQGDVLKLRSAAEHLATSSRQISGSAGVQSDSASSMAASVEEMTVGVDHIAKNAQDAQNYSHESDQVAASGARIVETVVSEIRTIADTVNQSAAAVEALGQQSDQISAIVGTIKEIADQTNLLALNAAIEAARAGESGRGFAVVADEVRKLAERTTKSTQEIADMIGAIQNGTAQAVTSMKHGVERVAVGVDHAQQAGEAIQQVQRQSRQVVEAVSEITVALREQAAASTEIAQNVERIAQMAEENNAAAGDNADTAGSLRVLAEALSKEVGRFRT